MSDPLVEKSREVREQMLRKYGGLDGLFDKLENMDRQRLAAAAAKRKKAKKSKLAPKKGAGKRSA